MSGFIGETECPGVQKKKRKQEKENDGNLSNPQQFNINDLPDLCLVRIFQFLPLKQKFTIAEVCRRWKNLSGWAWQTENTVCLLGSCPSGSFTVGSHSLRELPEKARTKETVERILKKCGCFVRELECHNTGMLPLVMAHCHKIDKLFISTIGWEPFSPLLSRLKNFLWGCRMTVIPGELFQILPCDTLIRLMLRNFRTKRPVALPDDALLKFCQLEMIELTNVVPNSSQINNIFNTSTLKQMCLDSFTLEAQLPPFTSLANLRLLSLGIDFRGQLPSLKSLVNLVYLNLRLGLKVHDDTLLEVSENCRELKKLSIESDRVTDKGILFLLSLMKLRNLTITSTKVTDVSLGKMISLEHLDCFGCTAVLDAGIINLMENSPNLKFLVLDNTGVSERLIEEAEKMNDLRFHLSD